jgi:endoglucanase
MGGLPEITPSQRAEHHGWLQELTSIPTASGRERGVIEWITRWAAGRPDLALTRDPAGNLVVARRDEGGAAAPLYFTAHLDHPAFVVERVVGPSTVQLEFRGGVMESYFDSAPIVIHANSGAITATISGRAEDARGRLKSWLAEATGAASGVRPGDIATWDLPCAEIRDGLLQAPACDDLAAAAAALAAYDALGKSSPRADAGRPAQPTVPVRLLFTRAEEVGFIGAIAACRGRTMPPGSRLLALENSRSFDDSPIGGGPIVRVGDRLSIFSPGLTGAVAAVAERIAGGAPPKSTQMLSEAPAWKWQRKLMPGGACEATVFCAAGYEATCLCLPLGNYHNMADLAGVQAGTNATPPRVAPEFISIADFDGLVDLLVACGQSLPANPSVVPRIEKLWAENSHVLDEA